MRLPLAAFALLVIGMAGGAEPSIRVGVASFQVDEVAGEEGTAVASRLATHLASRPLDRLVMPSDLGADPVFDARGRQVRTWAAQAGVDAIVVGLVTRSGAAADLDLAVEVRSGSSGGALAAYRTTVPKGSGGEASLDSLADSILRGLGYEPAPLPEVSAVATPGSAQDETEVRSFLDVSGNKDEPISIQSEELEVITLADGRRVVFDGEVWVMQGDVELWCDHLEAHYPSGESQPTRLLASGKVRLQQGNKRAECDDAVYLRTDQTITCRGNARLTQHCDVVRGQEILFDIDREKVRVVGAASVELQPNCEVEAGGSGG